MHPSSHSPSSASTDVALRSNALPESIEAFRHNLEALSDLTDVLDADALVTAGVAYAKAMGSKELTDRAMEMRVWLERKAGALALKEKLSVKHLRFQHGTPNTTSQRWFLFARVEDEQIESTLEYLKERHGELRSMSSIYETLLSRYSEQVEDGVWLRPDGRYLLKWKARGQSHRMVMRPGKTLKEAKAALVRERFLDRRTSRVVKSRPDLTRSYGYIRTALSILDQALPELPPDGRKAAEETITILHWAEDKLSEAIKFSAIEDDWKPPTGVMIKPQKATR